jgi:hypothetical protein
VHSRVPFSSLQMVHPEYLRVQEGGAIPLPAWSFVLGESLLYTYLLTGSGQLLYRSVPELGCLRILICMYRYYVTWILLYRVVSVTQFLLAPLMKRNNNGKEPSTFYSPLHITDLKPCPEYVETCIISGSLHELRSIDQA